MLRWNRNNPLQQENSKVFLWKMKSISLFLLNNNALWKWWDVLQQERKQIKYSHAVTGGGFYVKHSSLQLVDVRCLFQLNFCCVPVHFGSLEVMKRSLLSIPLNFPKQHAKQEELINGKPQSLRPSSSWAPNNHVGFITQWHRGRSSQHVY